MGLDRRISLSTSLACVKEQAVMFMQEFCCFSTPLQTKCEKHSPRNCIEAAMLVAVLHDWSVLANRP
jgi:hypothetical protein